MKYAITLGILFLIGSTAHAQESITLGEYTIQYSTIEEKISGNLYYDDDILVFSEHDTDGNGSPDLWLRYNNDQILELEAHDTDGDGVADAFFELDSNEEVTVESGDGLQQFEVELFVPENIESGSDDSAETNTEDSGSGSSGLIIFLIIIIAGVFGYKKFKKGEK